MHIQSVRRTLDLQAPAAAIGKRHHRPQQSFSLEQSSNPSHATAIVLQGQALIKVRRIVAQIDVVAPFKQIQTLRERLQSLIAYFGLHECGIVRIPARAQSLLQIRTALHHIIAQRRIESRDTAFDL